MFPIKEYNHLIPIPGKDPGGFGTRRKYDKHTGVDLYCPDGTPVYSIEAGIVTKIVEFTGFKESPWWENTMAVIVRGPSGYILYGEIAPDSELWEGDYLHAGAYLGKVKTVLKKDKHKTPTAMLHMELYESFTEPVWWKDNKPYGLLDITNLLLRERAKAVTPYRL